MSATVKDAVLLAAETLEENPERWLRGDFYDGEALCDTYRACVVGMTDVAAAVLGLDAQAGCVVRDLHEDVFEYDITGWNDHDARSAAEVAARLRQLAEHL